MTTRGASSGGHYRGDASTHSTSGAQGLQPEHRWPMVVVVLGALVLFALRPGASHVVPWWLGTSLGLVALVPLIVLNPRRLTRQTRWSRVISITFAIGFTIANQLSVAILVQQLLSDDAHGVTILITAAAIWVVQVVCFGLLYWELDRGGPVVRRMTSPGKPLIQDFLFPQETLASAQDRAWGPQFLDYLYVSLTNMTSFSPTDAMPLTLRAKGLMAWQSVTALVLFALVIARAVSILEL